MTPVARSSRPVQVEIQPQAQTPNASGTFVRAFLRNPRLVGTWSASTRRIARALAENIGLEEASTVVELGPGTGTVTDEILQRLRPGCRFAAVELQPDMARAFRARFPGVTLVQDDAAHLNDIRSKLAFGPLDCLVSALPYMLMPQQTQRSLIASAAESLRPGGVFSMITLRPPAWPGARRFLDLLRERFAHVELAQEFWARFPPAFIFHCRR